jgi:phosphoglycerate dehydrogenase-like enzyme
MQVGVLSKIPRLFDQVYRRCLDKPYIASLISTGSLVLTDYHDDASNCDIHSNHVMLADPKLIAQHLDRGFPDLKWLQSTYAGVNVIVDTSSRRDYVLTRVGSGFGPQMCNYCFSWILHFQQLMPASRELQNSRDWNQDLFFKRTDLSGKTISILGAGAIGSAIAHAAAAFGMKCIGLKSASINSSVARDQNGCSSDKSPFERLTTSLEDALACGDYVINCLPSTVTTRYVLTPELLMACNETRKRTGNNNEPPLLINIGRGDFVATETIISALDNGYLRHAVLDVFEEEPLPPNSPLWSHPKVSVTPHISAVSTPELASELFVDNLERFLSAMISNSGTDVMSCDELAKVLKYTVNREKGY